MKMDNLLIAAFLIIVAPLASGQNLEQNSDKFEQGVVRIPSDSCISLLDLFWRIDPDHIEFFERHNQFYKAIYLTEDYAQHKYSFLLGEAINKLYVLKGQYSETVDGELYFIGDFYNIMELTLITGPKDEPNKIGVLWGGIANPIYKEFELP